MPEQAFQSIAVRELEVKQIRAVNEDITIILGTGKTFKIKDLTGFELMKLDKDSSNKARLWLNGKQVFI